MKVLVACEFSGIVRDAFIAKGHQAVSCDLLPTERPGPHIQGDVLEILYGSRLTRQMGIYKWDMLIAHDPCTYQCNSGVRWLYERLSRWDLLDESCELTKKILNAPIEKIARENPIPHKYAVQRIGRKYDQIIQPWQFGHPETKATCLWLQNVDPLEPTNIVEGREQRIWKMSPSKDRGKLRSETFPGIAKAMAEQWG